MNGQTRGLLVSVQYLLTLSFNGMVLPPRVLHGDESVVFADRHSILNRYKYEP
jgi:hypothetical protein